ncbi:MAG: hypothetical protein HY871_07985, partial [Chloroflexi bacterium]|nr:hypothetical protein [Chloroflexota bacterium]
DYCIEHDLSLITSHDSYRRNPTETKIKGQDYEFLHWALEESERRTLPNRVRRQVRYLVRRYASPRRAVNKVRRLLRMGR